MKNLTFILLLISAFSIQFSAFGEDRVMLVNSTNPAQRTVSGIVVTNNQIPSSAVAGASVSAGAGSSNQVVKLNPSGLVDSTMLPPSAWQTNVNMQANIAFGTATWTNLVVISPSRTNGTMFVACRATPAEINSSGGWTMDALRLLRVDAATTNTVFSTSAQVASAAGQVNTLTASALINLTNSQITLILQGWVSGGDGTDVWVGTNAIPGGWSIPVINGTSMNILGF